VKQVRELTSTDLSSPALIVDLDVVDANLRAANVLLARTGIALRPHVKTHRTPALALMQVRAHACGVTCATVGEAEAMAAAGIGDILVANEIVSPAKLGRLAALAASGVRLSVAVDDAEAGCALGNAAAMAATTIDVLVDVDVGLGRCGVRTVDEAVAVARACVDHPALRLGGIMGYEGRLRASVAERTARTRAAFGMLREVRSAITTAGLPVEVVSGGGTSTLTDAIADGTLTEVQAGTYALMEADLDGLWLPFSAAVAVRSTVISCRGSHAVVDAGRKSIGCEYGPPTALVDGSRVIQMSEEHIVLRTAGAPLQLGQVVTLRPSQVRTTFNLHDRVFLERGGEVVAEAAVGARGASS
jgi:D-serine deaminase-like pyridoxal phosphate-dependent protein